MTTPRDAPPGKVLTNQSLSGPGTTTLAFSFPKSQAEALRQLASRIILKQTKRPGMGILARRAVDNYLDRLTCPVQFERERQTLERMVTYDPHPREPHELKPKNAGRTG